MGKLGIGTTSPTLTLSVSGNSFFGGNATTTGIIEIQGAGTSTFTGGLAASALRTTSSTATSTFANGLILQEGSLQLARLPSCLGGSVLETDAAGTITCGADAGVYDVPGQSWELILSGTQPRILAATSTNIGVFIGSNVLGNYTEAPKAMLAIAGTSTASVLIHASSTQGATGDFIRFTNSAGGSVFSVNSAGGFVSSGSSTAAGIFSTNMLSVGTTTFSVLQVDAIGTSTIQGFLNVTGANSTSTFTGALTATNISLTGAASSTFIGGLLGPGSFSLQQNSGRLGIGTTSPFAKLSVTGQGTGAGLAFALADSNNATQFVIQDNGQIGIGTTTPMSTLSIAGTSGQDYPLFSVSTTSLATVGGLLGTTTNAAASTTYFSISSRGVTDIRGKVLDPEFLAETQGPTEGTSLDGASSVFVSGNYAYVANLIRDSLAVIDISKPSNPVFLSEERGPKPGTSLDGAASVFVSGNYAYVANGSIGAGGRQSLAVIDISNPADPVFIAEERGPIPGTSLNAAQSVFVSGNYAYVANYGRASLAIIDISNPADPVFIAEERGPIAGTSLDGANSVFVLGNYAYVANDTRASLAVEIG